MSGHLPLWNPYVFGGHPFTADIQSGVFYPPSWVTTLLAGPAGYPFFALEVEAIVHIFLAGLGAYLLASRVAGSRVAGFVGGLVYAFGGYLSAYPSQQLSVLEVHTWLPYVLLLVHLATSVPFPSRAAFANALAGGLLLGLAILAGHPQASLYLVYTATAYFAFRLLARTGLGGWRQAGRAGVLWLILIGVGFGVAAVQLIPTTEFMTISTRSAIPFEMSGWAFPLRDLLQIILPGSVSYYSPMYVGILPLAFAIAAAFWRRKPRTGFWSVLAVSGLLISFGGNTIIHSVLFNALPGFGTFRHQERGIVVFAIAMAVLASIGARALFTSDPARVRRFANLAFRSLLAAIGVFVLFYAYGLSIDPPPPVQNTAAFLVLLLTLVTLLVAFRLIGLPRLPFQALAIAIVAFDLISVSQLTNFEKTQPGDQYKPTEIQKYLQRNDSKGRTYNDWQYPLNYGDVFGIRDINGASPLVVERYRKLLDSEPKEKVWSILGVKYFVTWQGGYPNGEKISVEKIAPDREANLYALQDPLPRAYVAHSATVIREDERALQTLLSGDPGTQAVLASEPAVAPSGARKRSEARVTDLSTERILVETTLSEPGILVLSEIYYPGWRATVNGQPAELLRAQYTLRGVALPAGESRVEFIFEPLSLKVGASITSVTVVGALLAVLILSLPRRR